jgi:hypothetical protein
VNSQKEIGCTFEMEIEKAKAEERARRDELIVAKAETEHLKEELTANQTLLIKANEEIIIKVLIPSGIAPFVSLESASRIRSQCD